MQTSTKFRDRVMLTSTKFRDRVMLTSTKFLQVRTVLGLYRVSHLLPNPAFL